MTSSKHRFHYDIIIIAQYKEENTKTKKDISLNYYNQMQQNKKVDKLEGL